MHSSHSFVHAVCRIALRAGGPALLALAGCSGARVVSRSIAIPSPASSLYQCFITFGGACPGTGGGPPLPLDTSLPHSFQGCETLVAADAQRVEIARSVFEDPALTAISEFSNRLVHDGTSRACGITPPSIPLRLSVAAISELASSLEAAISADAFQPLAERAAVHAAQTHNSADELRARIYAFVAAYMKAYFRNGHFVEVKVDLTALKEKIEAEIRERLSLPKPNDVSKILNSELTRRLEQFLPTATQKEIDDIITALNAGTAVPPVFTIGTIADTGFVARTGATYQFPALVATVDPLGKHLVALPTIDLKAVGAQVIRVFLEAVFDAWLGVPAVDTATGLAVKPTGLLRYDPDPTKSNVSIDEFAQIGDYANSVESAVGAAVGRLVRGASWFSLNNEAAASLVETAVAVIARKLAEKALWCLYACPPAGSTKSAAGVVIEPRPDLSLFEVQLSAPSR